MGKRCGVGAIQLAIFTHLVALAAWHDSYSAISNAIGIRI
jgi:hypothetical protein